MHTLLTITWDMGRGLDLGFVTLRYYSLLFAAGFVLGYLLMKRIFKKEGIPIDKLDTLLTYVVIATIVGARLGHVFFYEWDYYSQHPVEILKVWKGGLASHGAAVAIIIAIIIYSKRELKKSTLWMLDRVVITIALAAALIRMGNYFNSEIYGDWANSSMQTVFTNPTRERILENFEFVEAVDFTELGEERITDTLDYPTYRMDFAIAPQTPHETAENILMHRILPFVNSFAKENRNIIVPDDVKLTWDLDRPNVVNAKVLGIPRHPTQLFEALGYFLIFLILYRIYLNENFANRQGFLLGMFLILLFGFRFFIEFLKENQISSEEGQALNTGQYLSIPLVLAGLIFVIIAKQKNYEQAQ